MEGQILVISTIVFVCFIILLLCFLFIRKKIKNTYEKMAQRLEVEKNKVLSTPVPLELSKIEPIIKNDMMEEKYNEWNEKFTTIKEKNILLIDDILIELDSSLEKRDYKKCIEQIAQAELEICKAREKSNYLLEQIKDITLSEEKYRSIITKLKTKYRKLNSSYQNHKNLYDDMQEAVELQLENIEKKFLDFEKVMEANDYIEVVKIVKALDAMIDHMAIVVEEMPDLLLMAKQLIPKRIKEIDDTVKAMEKEEYSLEYLNIDYNIEESQKNVDGILVHENALSKLDDIKKFVSSIAASATPNI